MVLWQHVVLCKSYADENAPGYGCVSSVTLRETASLTQRNTWHTPIVRYILSSVRLTRYDMLPQLHVNIRKLISECF